MSKNYNNLIELIDEILSVFHEPLRRDIPRVEEGIEILVSNYVNILPEIGQIKELFVQFKSRVLPHIEREEKDFFPVLREIEECCSNNKVYSKCDLERFESVILKLEREHEEFDTYVFDLVDVFRDMNLHRESRETYKRYESMFSHLEHSIMKHTEIENLQLHSLAREKYDILCGGK